MAYHNSNRKYSKKPYNGPIFDVQAHAIVPGPGVDVAKAAIDPSVDEATRTVLFGIYDQMADNLAGACRIAALGTESIQVITIQMGFPPNLPDGALIRMASDTNNWLAARILSNPQLVGIATVALPPPSAPVTHRPTLTFFVLPFRTCD